LSIRHRGFLRTRSTVMLHTKKRLRRALLFAIVLAATSANLAHATGANATLTVKVEKVSPRGGDIRLALYDANSWPNDDAEPVTDAVVPARSSETVVVLRGLAPGTYGVKLFQDVNRNGKFDMNWLGLPKEKYGFSNDARPLFSEPGFDAAKFELLPGRNTIVIHLQ
jgi:uncharacterized protein (DUF2141 family)